MKNSLWIFFLLLACFPQNIPGQNRVKCQIPTAEEETAYVWRTLQDISFFEQHNYTVNLPKGRLIDTLRSKSKRNLLSQSDYDALEKFMKESVYKQGDYKAGYQKIKDQYGLLNQLLNRLAKQKRFWDFKEFDSYTVQLTLYGPGGSYNPEDGSIILLTTIDGDFKQYGNPANTIIHEITHMGLENSIVQKYKLNHSLKERIVDTFVAVHWGKYLPEYRIQDMGDKRIDGFPPKEKRLSEIR